MAWRSLRGTMLTDGSAKVCIEQAHLPAGTTWGDIGDHMETHGDTWGPYGDHMACLWDGLWPQLLEGLLRSTYNGVHYGISRWSPRAALHDVQSRDIYRGQLFHVGESANLCGQSRVILDRVSRNGPREDGNAESRACTRDDAHEGRRTRSSR